MQNSLVSNLITCCFDEFLDTVNDIIIDIVINDVYVTSSLIEPRRLVPPTEKRSTVYLAMQTSVVLNVSVELPLSLPNDEAARLAKEETLRRVASVRGLVSARIVPEGAFRGAVTDGTS